MKVKLLVYLLFCVFSLSAQQSVQVRELEKERLATLAEIEETNRLLKENKLTTSNALNRLNLLVQQINSRKKIIQLLNQEIISLDEEIGFKEMQVKTLEENLDAKKQHYAASIRKMYLHKNSSDYLLFILSSQNFTQSFHRIMYLKAYSGWQKKQAEEITEKQNTINLEKAQLLANRSDKLKLLGTRQSEEKQLSEEEESKKGEIKTLEKNKKALQEDLAKKEKQANALNRQIEKIIAEEVLKSEKAAKSESGENRTAEVKGGYAMTESERTLSSTFAGNKGKLPFPLKGNYKIVGYFGVHQHKELSKIVTNNNGIDIETTSGNEATAVFNGVVSRIFILPGYNNSIIVRHGNYLTLYSNIDQVYVKQGDKVNTGQALGKIYTDGEKGNSTLLHFEIWKEQTKLDPLSWIK
ncbi:MAG: peptidoglycan DD-metalloendopeptidase family protein [Candidatus Azobacteroides sp.]|nr:peptidoglycan DD-metalloendopeptidase family protein [Candidatus Azobacteroides sp.]